MDSGPGAYLGIDPGARGGLGWLDRDGGFLRCDPLPYETGPGILPIQLADLIRKGTWPNLLTRLCVIVEQQVPVRMGKGPQFGPSKVTFDHAKNYGQILGVLGAIGIVPHLVMPSVWKAAERLDDEKAYSYIRARIIWPRITAVQRGQDGQHEALLLAHYAKMQKLQVLISENVRG